MNFLTHGSTIMYHVRKGILRAASRLNVTFRSLFQVYVLSIFLTFAQNLPFFSVRSPNYLNLYPAKKNTLWLLLNVVLATTTHSYHNVPPVLSAFA